jgi:hypothetical protein
MHKINTILLFLIIFSLNSLAQITEEEYNLEKDELSLRKDQLNKEIEILKFEIDSIRSRIPEIEQQVITSYRELYVLKYGKEIGQKVAYKQIWTGMPAEMVRDSWGEPDKIDTNVKPWGVFTQWYYGEVTFFFRVGKLTEWDEK